jgi:hypothetical protein
MEMVEKTLDTIIVLRNDHGDDVKFGTADSKAILKAGEVGIHYLDNGNVMVKAGDGETGWEDLPQVESVLENDIMLTYSFGKHTVPTGGSKNAGGKNMTFSQWFQDSLKNTVDPTVTQPGASMSASVDNTGANLEVGSYITKIKWDGSTSNGTYKVGSGSDQGTGISSSNFSWAVSNNIDSQTSTSVDGSFTLADDKKKQITSTSEVSYATISATVTIDPSSAKNPKNNLGEDVSSKKITGFDTAGTKTKDLTANAKATGFHKPFWAVKAAAADLKAITAYTSSDVRGLANSANSTKGFPASLAVPAGSQQVMFFARAGAYSSLTATDDKAMNAEVSFTKVANAVKVKGNNEYAPEGTTGFDYDLWYVDWGAGIGAAKQLTLNWS